MRFIGKEVRTSKASDLFKSNEVIGPKVIAAGLPRCATSSMQAALCDCLGYDSCLHMALVMPYAERLRLVTNAFRETDKTRRQTILRLLFDNYDATADYPGCLFLDDLIEMYPHAKIVLNVRPKGAEDWHASIQTTLGWTVIPLFQIVTFWSPSDFELYRSFKYLNRYVEKRFDGEVTKGLWDIRLYDKHNEWAKEVAKQHGKEVLVFKPTMGWEPLCEFLGKPVPEDIDFPRINDKNFVHFLLIILYTRGLVLWMAVLGLPFAAWWVGLYLHLI